MADETPGITVLIATYNRAAVLRQTLQALTCVERTGIDCSIVIVDNNSTDNTREIATEYATKLPLFYLKEVRPGKNCALNKALRECELKDIVVFTDDDVTPTRNWLQEIASSVRKWSRIAVFGGKVEVVWPDNKQPEWAMPEWIMAFGFPVIIMLKGRLSTKPRLARSDRTTGSEKLSFRKCRFSMRHWVQSPGIPFKVTKHLF
jgi:Glycosyltransferases involved in cell wall biogenesis